MAKRRADRRAAAEADDHHLARVVVQQQRQVRHHLLRQHVAAVRRVDLAVDRERRGAGQLLHRHGRGGAFAVIEKRSRLQQRAQIEILGNIRRVHVNAAGQQRSIPRRAEHEHRDGGSRAASTPAIRALRESGPQAITTRAAAIKHAADDGERGLQAEARDEEEPGGERSRNGADRVDGVDHAEPSGGRRPLPLKLRGQVADHREGERERGAEAGRGRQDQCDRQEAALPQKLIEQVR